MIVDTERGTAPARTMITVTFIPIITFPLIQGDQIGHHHRRLTIVDQRSPVGLAWSVEMQFVRIDTNLYNRIEGTQFRVGMG